jgi:hypothetical protein
MKPVGDGMKILLAIAFCYLATGWTISLFSLKPCARGDNHPSPSKDGATLFQKRVIGKT